MEKLNVGDIIEFNGERVEITEILDCSIHADSTIRLPQCQYCTVRCIYSIPGDQPFHYIGHCHEGIKLPFRIPKPTSYKDWKIIDGIVNW